jgi:hypothetical protein
MADNGESERPEALRLYIRYTRNAAPGHELSLEEVDRRQMIVEASVDLPERWPEEQLSGFWYELQSAQGDVLYRKRLANPILDRIDVPSEEDPRRLVPYLNLPEQTDFTLLVPFHSEGRTVVIYTSPLEQLHDPGPAEPLWRIDLTSADDKSQGVE